jgi:hypothetical protein
MITSLYDIRSVSFRVFPLISGLLAAFLGTKIFGKSFMADYSLFNALRGYFLIIISLGLTQLLTQTYAFSLCKYCILRI